LQTDYLVIRTPYIQFLTFSHFTKKNLFFKESDIPEDLIYLLPFGLRLPIACGNLHSINLNANYFWSTFSLSRISPGNVQLKVQQPSFVDFQLRYEFKFLVAAQCGYRYQLSDWEITREQDERIVYSNQMSGFYFGVTIGLGMTINQNKGKSAWKTAKSTKSVYSYENFLRNYPNSRYTPEAKYTIELLILRQAKNGSIQDCDRYLSKYPDGLYSSQIKAKKEEMKEFSAYQKAESGGVPECDTYLTDYPNHKFTQNVNLLREQRVFDMTKTGGITECEDYLRQYPNGKFSDTVSKLKQEIQEKPENDAYAAAVSGSVKECDLYLLKYPNGRYSRIISDLKTKINIAKEDEYYFKAINGSIKDCDAYLNAYNNGKYIIEIFDLRSEKYLVEEDYFYELAKKEGTSACEEYLFYYPEGKFITEVNQIKQENIEKEDYTRALSKGFNECDNYLHHYPNGKYAEEIKRVRTEKYQKEEQFDYNLVKYNGISNCDSYLTKYPNSLHNEEVKKIREFYLNDPRRAYVKLEPGILFKEIIQRLSLDHALNENIFGGLLSGMGLYPKNNESGYTGYIQVERYYLFLEKSRLKEWYIEPAGIGSRNVQGEFMLPSGDGVMKGNLNLTIDL